jgi:hypothetical protein
VLIHLSKSTEEEARQPSRMDFVLALPAGPSQGILAQRLQEERMEGATCDDSMIAGADELVAALQGAR